MSIYVFLVKSHKRLRIGAEEAYSQRPMFTCEKCHREKPEHECVRLSRSVSFVSGLMVPPFASVVCRRCSRRVKRLGLVALAGMAVISLIMVLVLHFAAAML